MRIIAFVAIFDEGLEFGNVFGVCKVDDINGDVVLFEPLAKLLVFVHVFTKRVATENNDARLLVLVHSVLKRQLGYFDRSHEVGSAI